MFDHLKQWLAPTPQVTPVAEPEQTDFGSNQARQAEVVPSAPPSTFTYVCIGDETYGGIAAKATGDTSAYTEIVELNPGVDPTKLQLGTQLVLPSAWSPALGGPTTTPETSASVAPGPELEVPAGGRQVQDFVDLASGAAGKARGALEAMRDYASVGLSSWFSGDVASNEDMEAVRDAAKSGLVTDEQVEQEADNLDPLLAAIDKSKDETTYNTANENWWGDGTEVEDLERGLIRKDLTGGASDASTDIGKIYSGAEDASAFVCSPFTCWALINATGDPDIMKREISVTLADGTVHTCTFQDVANTQGGLFAAGEQASDLKADLQADDDLRRMGMSGALVLAGLGDLITDNAAVKPGDFSQTRRGSGLGGHATIIHRCHASGSAWFGLEGSPRLVGIEDTAVSDQLRQQGLWDGTDLTSSQGVFVASATFVMDESTRPERLGTHVVSSVEHLGAHKSGINADTGEEQAGVFTREAETLSATDGNNRVYLARTNDSPWSGFTPQHVDAPDGYVVAGGTDKDQDPSPGSEADDRTWTAWGRDNASWAARTAKSSLHGAIEIFGDQ